MKVPSLSPYGTFQGSLFQYSTPFPSLVAFESFSNNNNTPLSNEKATQSSSSLLDPNDDILPTKKCILLGGLSDGLIPTPYTKQLEAICHLHGWSLIQPILSSSYLGFGNGSLQQDSIEIGKLMTYLNAHRNGEEFAIVGHSTGCQDAVYFMKHGDPDMIQRTKWIALQAPVSDREGAMLEPNYDKNIKHAKNLVSLGKDQEMMPRDVFWAPITASRFLALQDKNGDDDFFSSDLSDDDLIDRLSHIGRFDGISDNDDQTRLSVLVAFSGKDEYVPDHIDKHLLLNRLCNAMNHNCIENGTPNVAIPLILETGNHNLSKGENDSIIFMQEIEKWL